MAVVMRPKRIQTIKKTLQNSASSLEGTSKIQNEENNEVAATEASVPPTTISSISVATTLSATKTEETVESASASTSATTSTSANKITPGGPSTQALNKEEQEVSLNVEVASKNPVDVKDVKTENETPRVIASVEAASEAISSSKVSEISASNAKEVEGQPKEGPSQNIATNIAVSASSAAALPSSAIQSSPTITITPLTILTSASADAAKILEDHKLLQEKLKTEQMALKRHTAELHHHNLSDLRKYLRLAIEKARQIVSVLISESNDLYQLSIGLIQAIKKIPHYESELNTASNSMAAYQNELKKWLDMAKQNSNNLLAQYAKFSTIVDKTRNVTIKEDIDTTFPIMSTHPMTANSTSHENAFHLIAQLRSNMGVKMSYMSTHLLYLRAILSRLKKLNIINPILNVIYPNDDQLFIYLTRKDSEDFLEHFKAEISNLIADSKKITSIVSKISTLMLRFELAAKTNNNGLSDITEIALLTTSPVIGAKDLIVSADVKTNADNKIDTKTKGDEKTAAEKLTASTNSAEPSASASAVSAVSPASNQLEEGVSQTNSSAANTTENTSAANSTASTSNALTALQFASATEAYQQFKALDSQLKQTNQALKESTKRIERLQLDSHFNQIQLAEKKLRQIQFLLSREFHDFRELYNALRRALCWADKKWPHDNKKFVSVENRIWKNMIQLIEHFKTNDKKDVVFKKFLDLAHTICKVQGVQLHNTYSYHSPHLDSDSLMIYHTDNLLPFHVIMRIRLHMGIKFSNISMDITHLQSLISKLWHLDGFEEIVRKVIYQPEFDLKRNPTVIKDLNTNLVDFRKALNNLNNDSKKMKALLYKIYDDLQLVDDIVKSNGQETSTVQELIDIVNLPIMDFNPVNTNTAAATVNVTAISQAPLTPAPSAPPLVFSSGTNAVSSSAVSASAAVPTSKAEASIAIAAQKNI